MLSGSAIRDETVVVCEKESPESAQVCTQGNAA